MKYFCGLRALGFTTLTYALLPITAWAQMTVAKVPVTPTEPKFDFSAGAAKAGYTRVVPTAAYSDAAGYGYEPGAQVSNADGGKTSTSDKPFLFSAKVPEGNFNVKVTFGDSAQATVTTLKAESARLMAERVEAAAGQVVERTFTVNVRTPSLGKLPKNATGREEVSLDQFDRANVFDWDNKLTLEVISPHAALRSIEITSAPAAPTVFLAGDSTVTDRDGGGDVSWGQLLSRFLKAGIAVSNHAQSGETLKSFANALRLDKILSQMKKGDYLFIQFGTNDMKEYWPQTYVEAETTYKAYLRVYIAEARLRGATAVLVVPMDHSIRETGLPAHGLGSYPDAIRELAKEEKVALIDLYKMSDVFYESAGADTPKILADGTHSTAYGGYEFAKCIVMGIKQNKLDLANFVVADFKDFDPAHPESRSALNLEGLFVNDRGKWNTGPMPATGTKPAGGGSPGLGPL